ncbi:Ig-like domain-containing protein [Paenibacillus sepulcri]|uniref:Ig-like domain-containing protein n=1 Tax=Paenibacillus sepulcri TaxID=359917 RepID=A0ABS7BW44_9BACL|nr:Ig-like domain-containing protein [Paenibacillus sepulcri]
MAGPSAASAASGGPEVLSKSPSAGATNVQLSEKLVLTFDENVAKGTGSAAISIRKLSDNTLFESYIVSSDSHVQIGASRNVVTITPSKSFEANMSYYVYIDAGAFRNEGNNANFAGLTSTAAWNFTTISTADTSPPALTSVSPGNGASASIGTTLVLSFNKAVYAASGNIQISNVNQSGDSQSIGVVSGSVTGSASPNVTVQLGTTLRPSSTYEVTIPSGAFQDASGNSFAGVSSGQWRFTTTAPPLGVPSLQPADNAFSVGIASNLIMNFPVNVAANTGNIRINKISDNSTVQTISVNSSLVSVSGGSVTINPQEDLLGSSGYYVLIDSGAFKDAGNPGLLYEGISDASVWNFTTDAGNDTTPPTLVGDRKPLNTQTTTTLDMEMNFSEPVYQGSGSIIIKNAANNAVFATIPVTSDKVSGGGTSKITVKDTSLVFVNNTSYYVQIGGQAFRDLKGNYFTGISGTTDWQFIVTQDTEKPSIVTLLPANNESAVALSGVNLELLYTEPIQLGSAPSVKIKRNSGSTNENTVTTKLSVDPQNNRKLIIAPESAMTANTNYFVEIASDTVTDLAGNKFDGILNQYQWTFKTASSSTGAPSVSKAEVLGTNQIVLTFNNTLDPNSVPVPANFYVTVNAASRPVTNVQVSGQTVVLTLQGTLASGQLIKVSYSAGERPIKSTGGTAAANFSGRDVSNNPDTTVPRQLSGTINGNTIILTFSENLAAVNAGAYSQFSAAIGSSTRTVTQVSGSGNIVFITFNGSPAASTETVTLSYYASTYALKDLAGNAVPSFSSFYIQNGQDTLPPVLQSTAAAGNLVTLTYNETMNPAMKPPTSAFKVLVNGTARAVTSINISGPQVVLTLASATETTDNVNVSYSGGSPALTDMSGNAAAIFNGQLANGGNGSPAASISLSGVLAKASTITVTFSTTLNASYLPSSTQFTVKVNNTTRPVSSIAINGAAVTLTLFTPVAIGDTITVSYTATGTILRSTSGVEAVSFTDINAANQTTWADNTSGDFEEAQGGGIAIKTSAAAVTTAVSPAGQSTHLYTITSEKITRAFSTIRTVSGMAPRVVFVVPDSENAAMVSVPLGGLEEAKKAASNASVAVVYKGATYEIPLSALDLTELAKLLNAAGAAGQLVISIDTSATNMASPLTTALNASKAQMMISPVNFDLTVTNGALTKKVNSLNGYVTGTLKSTMPLNGHEVAVVWMDPVTNKLSYVPTRVTSENGQSTVTFKSRSNGAFTVVKGSVAFSDINKHWAQNDILLMANKYVVEGTSLTTFTPDKSITRGEFAVLIVKGLGLSGDKQGASKFKDVNTSSILAAYIGAAANAGIILGMPDGTFMPNSPVTREQMASMMIRASNTAGVQVVLSQDVSAVLKKFSDSNKIGTWAQSDVAKAVQASIINGMSSTSFGGKSNATRAQATVMVKRLLDYAEFLDL